MHTGMLRLPAGFIALIVALLGVSGFVLWFPHTPVPDARLYVPSMYLTTVLCELATAVLLAIVFSKTRDLSLVILAVLFLTCGLLDGALFLTIPLPGERGSLLFPGNASPAYLFATWHAVLPIGALWYAIVRPQSPELTPAKVRTITHVGLPAVLALAMAGTATIVALTIHSPPLNAGIDLTRFHHSSLAYIDIPLTLVAIVALMRMLSKSAGNGMDFAVILAVVSSGIVIVISLAPVDRYSVPWFTGRALYFVTSALVISAALRDLVARVTESIRFEADELRNAAAAYRENAAVEVSLVKSRFVAMVSHELRTPLGGIIGMIELLERTSLNARQRSWAEAIHTSADSLLRIVNDLLDFSRVESGIVDFEDAPFDLAQVAEDVAGLFRDQAAEHGVALHTFVDPALPRSIRGDQTRIKQVLQNLVSNAVRFTHEGSIRIEAGADSAEGAAGVRFSVHDTGIGIGRSAQERIFNAFAQEDASTARRFGGTGLGLAIARHLVQLMGGQLTVRSVVGVGSTFTFTIPLRSMFSTAEQVTVPLRNVRVVVLESDPAVRALLERYVGAWEMSSEVYASTRDARAAGAAWLPGEGRCDVLLVGPGIEIDDAVAFVSDLRGSAMLGGAACIFIRAEYTADDTCPPGFDAVIAGPMRQSAIFNTIVRLRRHEVIENLVPAIDGIPPRRSRGERVLVAEDNDINQALLVAQLEHLGLQSEVVTDGAAAVEAAITRPFDLIFMDCHMPEVDGFEAARRIRSSPGITGRVPIIAITANVMPGYRDTCLTAGMDDFLAKPALIEPLARIIDRWLPRNATEAPAAAASEEEPGDAPDMRRRLREIFHGDESRVDATIALALRSLREGAETLGGMLKAHDADGARRIAHKLKGVAVEVGFVNVSSDVRLLERYLRVARWDAAATVHARVLAEIEREADAESRAVR